MCVIIIPPNAHKRDITLFPLPADLPVNISQCTYRHGFTRMRHDHMTLLIGMLEFDMVAFAAHINPTFFY